MKYKFLVIILIGLMCVGCSSNHNDPIDENFYEIVSIEDINNEEVVQWYEENSKTYGSYIFSSKDFEGYKYLLVSAGEKRTGGYSIEIKKASKKDKNIVFDFSLNEPAKDDAVIMVLTYPNILIKVKADKSTEITANLDFNSKKKAEKKSEIVHSEIMLYERVTGVYCGQIDNNFIEIDIDDDITFKQIAGIPNDKISFKLSSNAKKSLDTINENDNVMFDCFKDSDSTWVIDNIKSIGSLRVKSAKGIYTGRLDPNFIEIKTRGNSLTLKISQDKQDGNELIDEYTAVDIEYSKNKKGQLEVNTMKKAPEPGVGNTLTLKIRGVCINKINNDIIRIKSGETINIFWLAKEIKDKEINNNEDIKFEYYKDDYGRNVIVSFEKVKRDIKIDTGRFSSFDGNIIRIKISGVPDRIEPKEFKIVDEIKDAVLELDKNDEIKFEYYMTEGELNTIVKINKIN